MELKKYNCSLCSNNLESYNKNSNLNQLSENCLHLCCNNCCENLLNKNYCSLCKEKYLINQINGIINSSDASELLKRPTFFLGEFLKDINYNNDKRVEELENKVKNLKSEIKFYKNLYEKEKIKHKGINESNKKLLRKLF